MVDIASLAVEVDTRGLKDGQTEMKRLGRTGTDVERTVNRSTDNMGKGFSTLTKTVGLVGAALAALGTAQVMREFVNVNREAQRLKASLVTVTGSMNQANAAWGELEQFAKTTPFQLSQSVEGFIKMKALGLDPSIESMRSFGNTAAAMGKDLNQMIEAVADASTSEFERLKEFGIKARQEGDRVKLTFQGVTTEIGNNATEITEYLESIGNVQFAGAMERQMDTIGGAISNLQDEVDGLFRAVGEDGATGSLVHSINQLSETISRPELQSGLSSFMQGIVGLTGAAVEAASELGGLGQQIGITMAAISGNLAEIDELDQEIRDIDRALNNSFLGKPMQYLFTNNDELEEMRKKLVAQRKELLKASGVFQEASDSAESLSDNVGDASNNVEDLGANSGAAASEINKLRTEFESLENSLDPITASQRGIQSQLALLHRAWDNNLIGTRERYNELRNAAIDDVLMIETTVRESAIPAVQDLAAEADPFGKIWETTIERLQGGIADMFYDMLDQGKVTFDNILDLFKRMVAEMAAQKVMLSFGGGGILLGSSGASAGGLGGGGGFDLQSLMSMKNLTGGINGMVSGMGGYVNMLPESISSGFVQTGAGMVSDAAFESAVMEGGLNQGWNLNAGYGALATAGAGMAGGYVGNQFGEAVFDKQAESNYGSMAGGAIGAYVGAGASIGGPWGAAIGAFIGALVDVLGGGDGKVRSALGVQTNPGWKGADKDKSPIQIEAESGLLLTAYAKRAGDEAAETATQLTKIFDATDSALTGIFGTLGEQVNLLGVQLDGINSEAGSNESASTGFFGSAEFNGELSTEALTNATDDFVLAWIDKVNEINNVDIDLQPIFDLKKEGEVLADVLIRVNNEFNAVNKMLEAIGLTAYDTSVAGMAMADGMTQAFGGVENMNTAMATYSQLIFDQEEHLANLQGQLAKAFADLNVEMPSTLDGLQGIIEGLDRTTQEGKETFAALVQLAPAFSQITEASRQSAIEGAREQLSLLEQTVADEKDRITEIHNARIDQLEDERTAIENSVAAARENVDTVFDAFQRGLDQRRESIQAEADARLSAIRDERSQIEAIYQDSVSGIRDAMGPLQDVIRTLESDVKALQAAYSGLNVDPSAERGLALQGLAGGSLTGDELQSALRSATDIDPAKFSSRLDMGRATAGTKNIIGDLLAARQGELSAEQHSLNMLQKQLDQMTAAHDEEMERLDAEAQAINDYRENALKGIAQQLQLAQAQVDGIEGAKTNVATLTDVTRAITTYEQTLNIANAQISELENQIEQEEKHFAAYMEKLDVMLESSTIELEQALESNSILRDLKILTQVMTEQLGTIASGLGEDVPAYATGTKNHPGGLALVGERGPELVNMPPGSQVFTASQTKDMGKSGGEYNDAVLRALVKNTRDIKKMNDKMDQWNAEGLLTRTA